MAEQDPLKAKIKKAVLDERVRRAARKQVDSETHVPSDIQIQPASKIERRRLRTYFGGRLVRGSLQILVGPGEAGKGMVSVDLVARFTTGEPFPGERDGRPATNVLICVTEDSKERVAARLEAAGADLDRALFVEGPPVIRGGLILPRPVAFDEDAGIMAEKAKALGAGALYLETMLEHLGDPEGRKQWSSNNEADVRRAISPVVALCREADLVGWGVMHPRKSIDGGIEDSISGSAAFRNVGRGILHVYRDPIANGTDPTRLFLCSKSNYLAQRPTTLRFRIDSWERDSSEGKVVWGIEGKTLVDPRSAEDVWQQIREAKQKSRPRSDINIVTAERLLKKILADGLKPITEIEKAAEEAGISLASLRRAKLGLGVVSRKAGMPAKVIGWELPPEDM